MKTKVVKNFALVLTVFISLTLIQGCSKSNAPAKNESSVEGSTQAIESSTQTSAAPANEEVKESGKISKEKITPVFMICDNGWKINNSMSFWQEIFQRTNILFEIKEIPAPYKEKIAALVASGELVDMTLLAGGVNPDEFSKSGLLLNFKEYEQYLSNFLKWKDKYPELVDTVADINGNYFDLPCIYDWPWAAEGILYRQDAFEKNSIQIPKTWDEFYAVLKKLKELYPNSYPLECVWGAGYSLAHFANAFDTGAGTYFNVDTRQYQFGPMEENYKLLLTNLNKWYKEGLLDPQWDKLPDENWKKNMFEDKAFMGWHYVEFAKRLNQAAASTYPNVRITTMAPPALKEGVKPKIATIPSVFRGGVMISSKSKYKEELVKFMDYMYGPEGVILDNWGIEGVTYEKDADGKLKYTDAIAHANNPNLASAKQKWDFGMYILRSIIDLDAVRAFEYTKEVADGYSNIQDNTRPILAKEIPAVKFTDEEKDQLKNLETPLNTYKDEMAIKFVTGKEPLSNWDAYVNKIKSMNVDKVLEIYNNAAQRAKKY